MPYTQTISKKTVHGDERAIHMRIVADANSGLIDPGLSFVESIAFSPISMASASEPKLKPNLNAASAAAAGKILASGFASGDEMFLTVYGR